MPDLKVTATADVNQGVDGLKKVQAELGKTAVAAVKMDSTLQKTGKALGTDLKNGSNQATAALTNLGRVVQDAPFGIVGITNNINPLLESFERLKTETGSAGGALEALADSLLGGGGLGIAVSVVTSLMTVFALNNSGAGKSVDGLSKSVSEYDKVLKEAAATTAKEVADVAVLVESYKKENLTKQEKVTIIEKLQNIAPAYFANLDKEKTSIAQLTKAYDLYTASILRSVEIRVREGQLEKIIQRRIELQDKATRFVQEEVDANGKLKKSITALYDEDATGKNKSFALQLLTIKEQKELNKLLQDEKNLISTIAGLKQPQDFIDKAGNSEKKVRTIADVLKEMNDQLRLISAQEVLLRTDQAEDKIKALQKAFDELVKDFGLGSNNPIIADLSFRIDEAKARLGLQTLLATIRKVASNERQGEKDKLNIVVNVRPQFKIDPAGVDKELLLFQASVTDKLNETLNNIINDSISGFAETIGQALASGGDVLPNLFDGLIKNLGSQIQELGKFLVKAGLEMIVAKKAIEALGITPQVAVIAGIGLQILGAFLKASLNKKFNQAKFATGVRNFEGGFATVGERGPETVFLPRGSSVQPNNEMTAFGGGHMIFVPAVTLKGADLVIAFNRASSQMNRNN